MSSDVSAGQFAAMAWIDVSVSSSHLFMMRDVSAGQLAAMALIASSVRGITMSHMCGRRRPQGT